MRRPKLLVTSSYPAPYRVGVFQEMNRKYDLDVFFDSNQNEDRNSEWFCKSGELTFYVLNNEAAKNKFRDCVRNIRQYDCVLAYDPVRKHSVEAIFRAQMAGIPYFVNSDGVIYHKNICKRIVKRIFYPILYRKVAGAFSSCDAASLDYAHYGIPQDCIHKHQFSSLYKEDIINELVSDNQKLELSNTLCINRHPMFLSIGQFIKRKGFDILLAAWKESGLDGRASLYIIGGGGEKAQYEQYIRENDLKDVFLLDFFQKQELFDFYRAADVFVLPTREDIWGLVINEAMSQGLPVITTENCVAGLELIEDGVNGYIVKTEAVLELAKKMCMLAEDEMLRAEMARNNLEKIQDWTIPNIAKTQMQHIDVVLVEKIRRSNEYR